MAEQRGPIVNVPTLGRRAHLLVWHRHQDAWWGQVHWLTFATDEGLRPQYRETFVDHTLCVHADLIERVPGWDYDQVPRQVGTPRNR